MRFIIGVLALSVLVLTATPSVSSEHDHEHESIIEQCHDNDEQCTRQQRLREWKKRHASATSTLAPAPPPSIEAQGESRVRHEAEDGPETEAIPMLGLVIEGSRQGWIMSSNDDSGFPLLTTWTASNIDMYYEQSSHPCTGHQARSLICLALSCLGLCLCSWPSGHPLLY